VTDFAPHQLGHELSARYDVAHGASLTAVWGAWARYAYKTDVARFAQYGRNVWGIMAGTDEEIALAAIDATVAYFKEIGMPVGFGDVKEMGVIDEEALRDLTDSCLYRGAREFIGGFKSCTARIFTTSTASPTNRHSPRKASLKHEGGFFMATAFIFYLHLCR
jgi:alcohol dehydrogenase YqhD (iron-dependent ADH family)